MKVFLLSIALCSWGASAFLGQAPSSLATPIRGGKQASNKLVSPSFASPYEIALAPKPYLVPARNYWPSPQHLNSLQARLANLERRRPYGQSRYMGGGRYNGRYVAPFRQTRNSQKLQRLEDRLTYLEGRSRYMQPRYGDAWGGRRYGTRPSYYSGAQLRNYGRRYGTNTSHGTPYQDLRRFQNEVSMQNRRADFENRQRYGRYGNYGMMNGTRRNQKLAMLEERLANLEGRPHYGRYRGPSYRGYNTAWDWSGTPMVGNRGRPSTSEFAGL